MRFGRALERQALRLGGAQRAAREHLEELLCRGLQFGGGRGVIAEAHPGEEQAAAVTQLIHLEGRREAG